MSSGRLTRGAQAAVEDAMSMSNREKLIFAQAVYEFGTKSWSEASKLLSKHPLISRPKNFYSSQGCVNIYNFLMNEAGFERTEACENKKANPHRQLAHKYYQYHFQEIKEAIVAEEKKFKTLVREIDEIRAGLWDDRIRAKLKGKPIDLAKPIPQSSQDDVEEHNEVEKSLDKITTRPTSPTEIAPMVQTEESWATKEERHPPTSKRSRHSTAEPHAQSEDDDEATEDERETEVAPVEALREDEAGKDVEVVDMAAEDLKEEEEEEEEEAVEEPVQVATRSSTRRRKSNAALPQKQEKPPSRASHRRQASKAEPDHEDTEKHYLRRKEREDIDLEEREPDLAEMDVDEDENVIVDTVLEEIEEDQEDQDTHRQEGVNSRKSSLMPESPIEERVRRREGKRRASEAEDISSDYTRDRKRAREESEPMYDADSPAAASTGPRNTKERAAERKRFQNVINMLHNAISQHRNGTIFHNPIKPSEAPDYYDIVKRPMDLKTIKARVRDGQTNTSDEYIRDIYLMFANSLMYNRPSSDIFAMAEEMMQDSEKEIGNFRQSEGFTRTRF